uniref:RRM domain-containing protein n=1 Tax=Trichuris muris TaxID=70415 RepID=A0A5S6QHY7_TRIMR
MSAVVCVRQIPYGFFENEMFDFFGQFGRVTRLKLKRSEKTGRSKGVAFVEFKSAKVAEIAASTMNNYLLFDRILKCEVLPPAKVGRSLFKNWNVAVKGHQRNKALVKKANKHKGRETILAMCQRCSTRGRSLPATEIQ